MGEYLYNICECTIKRVYTSMDLYIWTYVSGIDHISAGVFGYGLRICVYAYRKSKRIARTIWENSGEAGTNS